MIEIDKDKTRIDMSLKDYEKLLDEIQWYKKLYYKITSNDYVDYTVNEELIESDDKKCCTYIFNAKKFMDDNFAYFYKDNDETLDYIEAKDIEFIIK